MATFLTFLIALPITLLLVSVCFDIFMTFAFVAAMVFLTYWMCELIYTGIKAIFKKIKSLRGE